MRRDHIKRYQPRFWLVTIVALAGLGLIPGAPRAASEFWDTKDWTAWSEMDCSRITGKPPFASPWANGVDTVTVPMGAFVGVHEVDALSGQFRSALPIRLALARQKQLDKHYDKLSPEERQAAENQIRADLGQWAEKSQAQVIFHVTFRHYQTGDNGQPRMRQETPTAANLVFPDGRRYKSSDPLGVQVDDTSVSYNVIFPREVEDKPLIRPEDKKFKVTFEGYNKPLEFDASKMVFHGKLEY